MTIKRESASNGVTLTPRQELAALALAAGCTLPQAAERSNTGERTLNTWLRDCPAFPRRVAELRDAMTSEAVGRLTGAMTAAADALLAVVLDPESGPDARIRAAGLILTHGVRVREASELAGRVAELEAAAATVG